MIVPQKKRDGCRGPVKQSMQSALEFFGINDRWQPNKGRCGGFWARHEDDLDGLRYEIRKAVRVRLKAVRTDFVENHEVAVEIVEVYQWLKAQLRKRGITL